MDLKQPISVLKGVGFYYLPKFESVGIKTLRDLLYYFPFRYEDFSNVKKIKDLQEGEVATVITRIAKTSMWRTPRKRMYIVDSKIFDDTGETKATWFNQPFLARTIKKDFLVALAGKVEAEGKKLVFKNPSYEVISTKKETGAQKNKKLGLKHVGRIAPIYYQTRGLTSKALRTFVSRLFENLSAKDVPEFLPVEIVAKEKLPAPFPALKSIHFPKSLVDAKSAWRRFAFENLFLFQLKIIQERHLLAKERAPQIPFEPAVIKNFIQNGLGFELTPSQKFASFEILKDMERPTPMNRLLQGDVGSGKTAVAEISALAASRAKYQTVFMAPTEILAQQHFVRFLKDFSAENATLALCTGSSSALGFAGVSVKKNKKEIQEIIRSGKADVIIGTHALISLPEGAGMRRNPKSGVEFSKVGLVIIDEQHRFGVGQRGLLLRKSINQKERLLPHFFSMSATPIPRSLALILYSDFDISFLKEKPPGRRDIQTKIVRPQEREKIYSFIKNEIKKGRQAFVVCPRVEENRDANIRMPARPAGGHANDANKLFETSIEIKMVKKEYERLQNNVFKEFRVGILYGKMKPSEKEKTMRAMAEGNLDILVSSSVVEVGVDVPNASVIMIEDAEHFGLSQLHQLRGRVGRSGFQSYCFLMADTASSIARSRLEALESSNDGFFLAKKDLLLRGPGQFFGTRQAGLPDIAMDSLKDLHLIAQARNAAVSILRQSPDLARYPRLKAKVADAKETVLLG